MGLTNTDASQLTSMRLGKTLYGWKKDNRAALNVGASILSEQTSQQSGLVTLERRSVGTTFAYDPTLPVTAEILAIKYPFTGASESNSQ
jgi:hypothetical protein